MKTKLYLICLLLASCQSNEIELNNIIQQKERVIVNLPKETYFLYLKNTKTIAPLQEMAQPLKLIGKIIAVLH